MKYSHFMWTNWRNIDLARLRILNKFGRIPDIVLRSLHRITSVVKTKKSQRRLLCVSADLTDLNLIPKLTVLTVSVCVWCNFQPELTLKCEPVEEFLLFFYQRPHVMHFREKTNFTILTTWGFSLVFCTYYNCFLHQS